VAASFRFFLVGGLVVLVLGCAASSTRTASRVQPRVRTLYSEDDGLTCQTRVIIHERTEPGGIAAEYSWLYEKYPGCKMENQSLGQCGAAVDNIVSIKTVDGRMLEIHFDISSFFEAALERPPSTNALVPETEVSCDPSTGPSSAMTTSS
jgi:hypothetical protein